MSARGGRRGNHTKPRAAWDRDPAVRPGPLGPVIYWTHNDGRRAVAKDSHLIEVDTGARHEPSSEWMVRSWEG